MRDQWVPADLNELAAYLLKLRERRDQEKESTKSRGMKRKSPTVAERAIIASKTDGRCHICGGHVDDDWQADHVLSHSSGGEHSIDNYLPAHRICNNYRWDYLPEEFQEILRMGVWLRTQIEQQTRAGKAAGEVYLKHEKARLARRSRSRSPTGRRS
ncbi:MAG: HNH endonuclease [Candidatus Krumholzibacteria bacterium]|jgi:5-methylcytosine-specific restriction endonuclease McrA|nr:HNH endonuclease [Candidatus Krumholzibacteria bacterium]